MFSAPDEYHGEPACRSCIEAVGPAAGQGYDDFPAYMEKPAFCKQAEPTLTA